MSGTDVEQFGVHLMLDGYGADPHRLKDKNALLGIQTRNQMVWYLEKDIVKV